MSNSSKNSKESTSHEIDRGVKEDEGIKLQNKSKKTGCTRTNTSSTTGSSKVRRIFVEKKRRLQKIMNPPSDCGSDADEFDFTWSNFFNHRAYFL